MASEFEALADATASGLQLTTTVLWADGPYIRGQVVEQLFPRYLRAGGPRALRRAHPSERDISIFVATRIEPVGKARVIMGNNDNQAAVGLDDRLMTIRT